LTQQNISTDNASPQTRTCILCGADAGHHQLYPGILRCPSCSLVFADTLLSSDELERLYQREYFFGDEYLNYMEDKPYLQRNFRARLKTLRKFSSGGHLFEIGCAYGYFLELAAKTWQAEGCDISAGACQDARSRGLNAAAGDFLSLPLNQAQYDVVALWDTIEHLARPDLYIERASQLLKSGGVLCATTGDIDSLMARTRGERWRLIHPPTHFYYFSKKTIGMLLAKHGLEIVHFQHVGYSRSVQQMLYSLIVLNRETKVRKGIYNALKSLFSFPLYLNLYDIMFVIARKK
jgi:SAM-dependent methyltransferase